MAGIGPDVAGFQIGDEVAVFPLLWCGRCAACEQGRYAQCDDYDYLGSRSDGAFAEYVVAPQQNLVPLPAGVSLAEAAMTEPAAVALHAIRRAGDVVGETVVIFGAGPIGLMVGQWARIMGAAQVILFDIVPEKIEMAQDLGFDWPSTAWKSIRSKQSHRSRMDRERMSASRAQVCPKPCCRLSLQPAAAGALCC